MSVAPAPAPMEVIDQENSQTGLPKNMVLDPGWFDGDQTKFKDWWRGIRLFLKSNRVVAADKRITAVLAQLRGGVAGIYAQKKIDKLDDTNDTQSWEEFVKEIKTAFSDKSKAADTEWKIKTFKQGKKHIVDFMIEFEALAIKADTDDLYAIFLLKKNLMDKAPKELNAKAYAMTLKEKEALNQWLDEQLKVELIVESKSRYTAPCFYIPKKDGSLQLVQDYRKLNQVTIKDKTPLPLIGEVIDKLKEARYFNKLDLIWGCNNV